MEKLRDKQIKFSVLKWIAIGVATYVILNNINVTVVHKVDQDRPISARVEVDMGSEIRIRHSGGVGQNSGY